MRYNPEEPFPNVDWAAYPWAPPEGWDWPETAVELIGGEAHGKKVPRELARRLGVIRVPLPEDLSYAFLHAATYTEQFEQFLMEQGMGGTRIVQYRYDYRWNRAFYVGEEN
jgi:hypothetical protein